MIVARHPPAVFAFSPLAEASLGSKPPRWWVVNQRSREKKAKNDVLAVGARFAKFGEVGKVRSQPE
jgi:hypothetical protein